MTLILTNPILDTPKARHAAMRRVLIVGQLRAHRDALMRLIPRLKRQHKGTALAQADLQRVTAKLMEWGA
jgi:hypothetical protein